jgi:proteasome assembly chaperone (PAC2) family protein
MDFWLKLWPVMLTFVGVIGALFTLKADVDSIKEGLGEPGTLPVIELKIEQLDDRAEKLEKILEQQQKERQKLMDVMRTGQEKVDSLINLLLKEHDKRRQEQ